MRKLLRHGSCSTRRSPLRATSEEVLDEFERVWTDYVMPVAGLLTAMDMLFRQRVRNGLSIFLATLLAVSSILMGLNTLAKLNLL